MVDHPKAPENDKFELFHTPMGGDGTYFQYGDNLCCLIQDLEGIPKLHCAAHAASHFFEEADCFGAGLGRTQDRKKQRECWDTAYEWLRWGKL